ncbi:MAG: Uma2 family endonuclease [Minicystis sp.]
MALAAARTRPEAFEPTLVEASYDPFDNNMGEGSLQRFVSEVLRPLIERLLADRGQPTFVGADQYVGKDPHDPRSVVAPDVYVLPGVAPGEDFDFWKVWQTGIVPSFALEIVSSRKGKDYKDAPLRYAALGVAELVIFESAIAPAARRGSVADLSQGRAARVREGRGDERRSGALQGARLLAA